MERWDSLPSVVHHTTWRRDWFCTLMHHTLGRWDTATQPCGPEHRAEGWGSPPLCTTAKGKGLGLPTPVHVRTRRRDTAPHPLAPKDAAQGLVVHPRGAQHRAEGPSLCAPPKTLEGQVAHPCDPQHRMEGPLAPPLCATTHGAWPAPHPSATKLSALLAPDSARQGTLPPLRPPPYNSYPMRADNSTPLAPLPCAILL